MMTDQMRDAFQVFGQGASIFELQTKILREFLPALQKRFIERGINVRLDVETLGDTINIIICSPNGIRIEEYAMFVDKFNSPNWMPVYIAR